MADEIEYSKSGQPMIKHEKYNAGDLVHGDINIIESVSDHIEKNVGPITQVLHEVVSMHVHVDILQIDDLILEEPNSEYRNCRVFVTCGASEKPMNAPPAMEAFRFSEFAICLPKSWPISVEAFKNEAHWWPLRLLKIVARYPFEYNTFFSLGHTMDLGDMSKTGVGFSACVVTPAFCLGPNSVKLQLNDRTIYFMSIVPLFPEELKFKLDYGMDKLEKKFEENNVFDIIDPTRINVCTGKYGIAQSTEAVSSNKPKKKWWQFRG